jgi:ABC-type transport system involved in Fe-S cluster assembly fused permease/ATPase subunit
LRDINLSIAPNQIVGLVGGTGAGKSTLLSPGAAAFTIRLRARDARWSRCPRDTKKSLRAQIAYRPSKTRYFSPPPFARTSPMADRCDEKRLIEAARRAQATSYSQMPQGYSSLVGERGGHLECRPAAAHRNRASLSEERADSVAGRTDFCARPSTEAAIMETIKELMRGRTTLIATHRLATIHNLDQIIVLDHGRIIEQGRGPELLTAAAFTRNFMHRENFQHSTHSCCGEAPAQPRLEQLPSAVEGIHEQR